MINTGKLRIIPKNKNKTRLKDNYKKGQRSDLHNNSYNKNVDSRLLLISWKLVVDDISFCG